MIRAAVFALRLVSYAALAAVAAALAAVVFVSSTDVCPRFDEGAIQCVLPIYAELGGIGMLVLVGSVFTVLPAMFAIAGALFLWRDLRSLRRRPASTDDRG